MSDTVNVESRSSLPTVPDIVAQLFQVETRYLKQKANLKREIEDLE
jgi:hypothetical protein